MDSDEFRVILSRSGVEIWAIIEAAIRVASSDYGEELRRQRDRIVESLYTGVQLCRNCNDAQDHLLYNSCDDKDHSHGDHKKFNVVAVDDEKLDEGTLTMGNHVPWDITTEILSRLPVKSLLRFKCVSKSFYSLISYDSLFIKKHLYHHQSSLKILLPDIHFEGQDVYSCFLLPVSPARDFSKDMIEPVRIEELPYRYITIHNSCDGLLCIQLFIGDVLIWNPSTREVKKFPGRDRLAQKENGYQCWFSYSLAHDSRLDIYKLFGLVKHVNNAGLYRARFYSTKMEVWRYVEDHPSCDFVEYTADCAVVSGAFHWLGSSEEHFRTPHIVVSLDISNETYGTIAMPQALCNTTKYPKLCVLKGKLSVICLHNSGAFREIWVMKEYGVVDSMMRMFRISRVEIRWDPHCLPLYMLEDDTVIIYRGRRTSFFKDGRLLCNLINVGGVITRSFPIVYIESLVSPHDIL